MKNDDSQNPTPVARRFDLFRSSGFVSLARKSDRPGVIEALAKDRDVEEGPDGFAIPPETMRIYGENSKAHFNMGLEEADLIREILIKNQLNIAQMPRVLEFGCANSRVLRHFAKEAKIDGHQYFGTDVNANTLLWSMTHLSPPFHYFVNTTAPHLPFQDQSLDFIYAMSILTHIDSMAFAWIYEFARLLKPGAHALITIIDHESFEFLEKNGRLENRKELEAGDRESISDRLKTGDTTMVSLSSSQVGGLTFFSISFLLEKISHLFEPVDQKFGFMTSQQGLLLRRV